MATSTATQARRTRRIPGASVFRRASMPVRILQDKGRSVQAKEHMGFKFCRVNQLTSLQQQIDDTVGVMRENINKVSQRGERLDSLQDKTDNLAVSAQGFRRGANRVRKQMWWKDMKMRICIIVGIIILLIVIIVPSGMFLRLDPWIDHN